MKVLITGGAGFMGSAFVRLVMAETGWRIVNLDKLTYAGNPENLASIAGDSRYRFVHGDICDASLVESLMVEENPDAIVHFAAESHVDRSILSPEPVIRTNLRIAQEIFLVESPRAMVELQQRFTRDYFEAYHRGISALIRVANEASEQGVPRPV